MEKQFTATVYIIDNEKVLLIFHRKLQKWLPPGGHMDCDETPPQTAKREALEETGLEIEFIQQENIWIDHWNAQSFERPYLCLLENIPAFGEMPAHQHIDFVYLAYPVGGQIVQNLDETLGIRWFTWDEIAALSADEDIFADTQQTLKFLLKRPLEIKGTS